MIKSTKQLSDVLRMLNQFPSEEMNASPISDLVNNPVRNEISMIHPIGEKLPADAEPQTRLIRQFRVHKEKSQSDGLGLIEFVNSTIFNF